MATRPLTSKQAAYRDARVLGLSRVEAYRQAYDAAKMSPKAIQVEASRLDDHPAISLSITLAKEQALAQVVERTGVTIERVVQEYARIAFADMRRFASVGPGGVALVDSEDWTDDDAAAVAELAESTSKDGGSIRFKLHSKVAALDSLAKHLGMFKESDGETGAKHLHLHGLTESDLRALAEGFRRD